MVPLHDFWAFHGAQYFQLQLRYRIELLGLAGFWVQRKGGSETSPAKLHSYIHTHTLPDTCVCKAPPDWYITVAMHMGVSCYSGSMRGAHHFRNSHIVKQHYCCTVDDRKPARPYVDLIYQKHRNYGSRVHMYTHKVMQDFYHQRHGRS